MFCGAKYAKKGKSEGVTKNLASSVNKDSGRYKGVYHDRQRLPFENKETLVIERTRTSSEPTMLTPAFALDCEQRAREEHFEAPSDCKFLRVTTNFILDAKPIGIGSHRKKVYFDRKREFSGVPTGDYTEQSHARRRTLSR